MIETRCVLDHARLVLKSASLASSVEREREVSSARRAILQIVREIKQDKMASGLPYNSFAPAHLPLHPSEQEKCFARIPSRRMCKERGVVLLPHLLPPNPVNLVRGLFAA